MSHLVFTLLLFITSLMMSSPHISGQTTGPIWGNYQPKKKQKYEYANESDFHLLFQDAQGYLWGSDLDGSLIRYDGQEIRSYAADAADSTAYSGGRLWANNARFIQDKTGKIWIKGQRTLDQYDPETEQFAPFYKRLFPIGENSPQRFDDIYEDREGNIWICAMNTLCKYNIKADTITSFTLPAQGRLVFEDWNGNIWVNVYYSRDLSTLYQLNLPNGKLINRLDIPLPELPLMGWTRKDLAVILENEQKILLLIGGNLFLFRPEGQSLIPISRSNTKYQFASSIYKMDNLVLVGTFSEYLFQFNPHTTEFHLFPDFKDAAPKEWYISNVLQTRDKAIWLNAGGNVYKFLHKTVSFNKANIPIQPLSIQYEETMFDYKGSVYFIKKSSLIPVRETSSSTVNIDTNIPGLKDQGAVVRQFEEDKEGNLWMAVCWQTGQDIIVFFRKFGVNNKVIEDYSFTVRGTSYLETVVPETPIAINSTFLLMDIIMDNDNGLWFGAPGLLSRFDVQAGRLKILYNGFSRDSLSPIKGGLKSFYLDRKNHLWVSGYQSGLSQFDQVTEKWTDYPLEHLKDTKVDVRISAIFEDSQGNMWVGTEVGLIRLVEASGNYRKYNEKDFLPNSDVKKIFEDHHQNLWVTTGNYFARYYPEEDRFIPFTRNDGVDDAAYYNQRVYHDKDHFIYLSSNDNYIVYFHPDSMIIDKRISPIVFTDFQLASQTIRPGYSTAILQKSLDFTEAITLEYAQNDFSIHYTAPEYIHPNETVFAIQLEGFNNDWQEVGKKRESRYTNLNPGRYTFKVKVRNHHGFWSETPRTLKITILPPWYRTWWAWSIWIALFFGSIFALYRIQLRRQLEQAEAHRLKELDLAKSQLYTNITHEFRTPLTVILGMVEQVRNDPGNWLNEGTRLIRRNGKQLLNLVNQLLDLSKLESGHLPLNFVQGDVVSYLHYLSESFHSYADSKDIRLHFRSDFAALPMDHDPEKLQNVVSNLLSNAIKFTPAGGDVYFDLRKPASNDRRQVGKPAATSSEELLLQVSDNGPGISPEHLPHIFDRFYQTDDSHTRRGEGTGIGLALVKELVKVMGGHVEVESEMGKGTKFSIWLPVTRMSAAASATRLEDAGETLSDTVFRETEKAVETSGPEPNDRFTVLLVEDNPDVVTYLSSVLSLHYRIETARNGQEGIEKALELTPDIIVSDVMMPHKDGFELCQELKSDERTSHIPIILLTAKADQKSKIEGLTFGADAYLAKPFHREELLIRLEKLIELRRRLQERYAGFDSRWLSGSTFAKSKPVNIEDLFMQKVIRIIEAQMADENFGMPQLCKELNMSRTNLFRKLKALTGKSATLFIRSLRLEKAKTLLETTEMNVTEVCFAVGFTSPNYFSRVFQEEFGVAPSEVRG